MGTSSARPELLARFAAASTQLRQDLATRIAALRATLDEAGARGLVGDGGLGNALTDHLAKHEIDDVFVDVVREAFVTADATGLSSMSEEAFRTTFEKAARDRGLDPDRLDVVYPAISVDAPVAAGIPRTSGFAADPVSTATGHFAEVEHDLVWPDRLWALRWPRAYSSRFVGAGPHGRGWACWAATSCRVAADGTVEVTTPDGQLAVLPATADGWGRAPGFEAQVTRDTASDELVLAWDLSSARAGQQWRFDDGGELRSVWSERDGRVQFVHTAGLLTRLAHDGGRWLDISWDGPRVAELVDSVGRRVRYRYDAAGDLVGVERAPGDQRYVLDERGRIVELWDADGVRACHNVYDDEGRVLAQTSPFDRVTRFGYGPGLRTTVSDDAGGPVDVYEHDPAGRLTAVTDGDGNRMVRRFDPDGRCTVARHFDGTIVRRAFDADGNQVALTGPEGYQERWAYDDAGRVTSHDAPGGWRVDVEYADGTTTAPSALRGPDGWAMQFEVADGLVSRITDADGVTLGFTHDADGNAVRVVDGSGRATTTVRHPSGPALEIRLADGAVFRQEVDDAGRITAVVGPTGDRWTYDWSPAGRCSAVVEPDGSRTTFEHGRHGRAERIIDQLGAVSELCFDTLERLVGLRVGDDASWTFGYTTRSQLASLTDPKGGVRQYEHDADGRLVSATDPMGRRTTQRFDALGRLVAVNDRAGGTTQLGRDEVGRVIGSHAADGAVTAYAYDAWNRVTLATGPDGATISYRYTPAGRLAEARTGEGRVAGFAYDPLGRLTAVTDDAGRETRYEWDELDRLAAVVRPSGREVRLRRDAMGRVVERVEDGRTWQMEHDHAGRVVASIDPAGAVRRFAYDRRGKLVAATDPIGGTTTYEWDARGNCTAVVDPFGGEVRTEYDLLRQVRSRTDQLGRTTVLERDALGRRTGLRLPDGRVLTWRLDELGRSLAVAVDGSDAIVTTRDRRGRPTSVVETGGRRHRLGWSRGGRLTDLITEDGRGRHELRWRYDTDGRLVERQLDLVADAPRPAPGSPAPATLRRDAAGRVVERRDDTGVTSYRYDAAGQLVGSSTPTGEWAWAYDVAGRLVHEVGPRGERSFAYDAAHQLVAITSPDGVTALGYDACGRRVSERGPGRDRTYSWSPLGHLTAVATDGRRTTLDVDAFGSLAAIDDRPLSWDPTQAVPEPVTAAGGPDRPSGDMWDPLGEVGLDGLVWLRNRVLDPGTRQFLSPDPMPGVPGSSTMATPYPYAGNDPVGFVDPLGLQPLSIEQYDEIRKQETGVQWGHIAMAGLVVASFFVPGGPLIMAGLGAALGAAPAIINGVQTGNWDWGAMAKGAVVGGVAGYFGGALLGGEAAGLGSVLLGGAVAGGGSALVGETWDGIGLPGGDGSFDVESVVIGTAVGAGTAGLTYGARSAIGGSAGGSGARPGALPAGNGALDEDPLLTVYRFHDANDPLALRSRLSSSPPDVQARINTQIQDPVERLRLANLHMEGQVADSPFVSVTTDPALAATSTDPWLRTIATGRPGAPGAGQAPHLSTFNVPQGRLVAPPPTNLLSISEGEMVFVGDDLARFLAHTVPNPY